VGAIPPIPSGVIMLAVSLAFFAGVLVGFVGVAALVASHRRILDRALAALPGRRSPADQWAPTEVDAELPPAAAVDPLSEDMERAQRELLARYGREFSPDVRARARRDLRAASGLGGGVMMRVKP
jgi:hypothetical protein